MEVWEKPETGHAERMKVYEYVEKRGCVELESMKSDLDVKDRSMAEHVELLRRHGYLEDKDNQVCDALY